MTDLIALQKEKKELLCKLDPLNEHNTFEWREEWGEQRPLVEIVAYCLMPNHYHLLLREIVSGGISKFMQKIGTGYTMYLNAKSGEVGRIFQGQYKGKTITDESYLQYMDAYIQLLNPLELFGGGILAAINDFDKAFQFALGYPFCSLGESFGLRNLNIVKRDYFSKIFPNVSVYKDFCKDALIIRSAREFLGKLTME